MSYANGSDDGVEQQKLTLFCPECDHRGHVSEDWIESRTGSVRALTCPECGETVDKRGGRAARPPAEAD